MKRSKRTKFLSLLLSCVMLLGLLPMATQAATQIEAIRVGIDVPTAGEKFDFTAEGSCEEYTVGNVSWYHLSTGKKMSTTSVAEAGQTYEVRIQVSSKSGYSISGNTVGLINGLQSVIDTSYLRTTFYVSEPPKQITSVEVELDAPVPGAKADFTGVCGNSSYILSDYFDDDDSDNYTSNGIQWIDATTKKVMDADDTFVAGHTYQAFIHLKTRGNYEFHYDYGSTLPVTAKIVTDHGTYTARTAKAYERDPFEEIDVICDFGVCDYQKVSSVAITGLDAPKDGKAPDYSAALSGENYALKASSASNPFVVNGVSWYDETAGNTLTATAKFTAGHTYSATVYLVPASGSKFAGSVSGTVNGYPAAVTGNGSEIQVKYTFSALATRQITSVAIEGVTAPAAGAAPSYVAILKGEGYQLKARNDAYCKNGICWSVMESRDLPVSSGKFEGGKQYQITMYLVAEEGYEFSATAGGALQVKATLNGKPVLADILGNKQEIVVTYYFTEATADAKISTAAVAGIDAPAIGASPDYTATISDSRYQLEGSTSAREKNGITWINNKTGYAMTVGASKFEAGVSYTVVVGVTAADGYAFVTDSNGMPNITGAINQKTAKVSGQDAYNAYLSYTFPALEEEVLPPAPIVFEDVKPTDYFSTPVQWAVNEGITNGTSATKFSPNMTCSQAHILTFLWRAVDSPKPVIANPYSNPAVRNDQYFYEPFLWAWEKGLISNTALDPNAPCSRSDVVTYLWKLEGSPKTGSANFTDVPSTAPYAQAVAWAVEQGITNGMSATTFGPDLTCTRGQIVTFLWRYSNI